MRQEGYTLIRGGLICYIFGTLVLLDGDKSLAAILAFPQITGFFCLTNTAGNIKCYFKTGSIAAMGTKPGWHPITSITVYLAQRPCRNRFPRVLENFVGLSTA